MEQHVHTTSKRRAYDDGPSFVEAAQALGRDFDYSKAQYAGAKTPVEIVCHKHGSFWQSPTNHMEGKGCPQCKYDAFGDRSRKTHTQFVQEAHTLWAGRYDYSGTVYVHAREKVAIRCPEHGIFEQTPTNHLSGKQGCTKCNHTKSAPEDAIAAFLARFTTVEQRNRTLIAPKEVDIYLPEHKLAVEFCGMYWHSHGDRDDERKNKKRHIEKHKACEARGVRLLTIYETEWTERPETIKRLLRNAIGKSRGKLMARKCRLAKTTVQEARAFYEKYHPQGGSGNGEHYGLYHNDKLVACMRFTFGNNDRGHGAKVRQWTLSRYATRLPVAGAASKLFKAFLSEHKPSEVKSFSDNRLFGGGMYEQLGFVLEEEVPADYQVWSLKAGLRPKPHYQRRLLPARLREHGVDEPFDPKTDDRTEAEMTYMMGARRIYDCGKKRWLWTAP
jgi:G:T-mismatch repair DNA endonuclease (very short patch repair protein)